MKRKEFSFQLFNRRYEDCFSWRCKFYVIYFGDRPVHKYIEEFPQGITKKAQKQKFISALLSEYERRRERRNRKARERYHLKKKTVTKKIPYKDLSRRSFTISVSRKRTRGVFRPSNFVFRHTTLTYKRPLLVNFYNKEEFKKLTETLRTDMKTAFRHAYKLKPGRREWIFKMVTPYYDENNKLLYSEDITDPNTGKITKAKTDYSYGFSLARVISKNVEFLEQHIDNTIDDWILSLKEKYINMVKAIRVTHIIIEETMSIKRIEQ